MNKLANVLFLSLALGAYPARADFIGSLAPANFSVVNTGTLIGSSPVLGTAIFTTTQLTLRGSDANGTGPSGEDPACAGATFGFDGPCQIQAAIAAAGTYSFDWSYSTADGFGPGADEFGFLLGSVRFALSDPGGALLQSGTQTVDATTSFGWYVNCTDCIGGAATAVISNASLSQSPSLVPEPATPLLVLGALLALGLTRRP